MSASPNMRSYGRLSELMIGILSGAPFVAAMLGIMFVSYYSDKHGQERRLHAAIPTALTGIFMIAAAFVPTRLYYLQVILFIASGFTLKMLNPMVFSLVTEVLPTRNAVPAIAIISGVGNFIGQFASPLVVGYAKSASNNYFLSLLVLGICAILGGVAILMAQTHVRLCLIIIVRQGNRPVESAVQIWRRLPRTCGRMRMKSTWSRRSV